MKRVFVACLLVLTLVATAGLGYEYAAPLTPEELSARLHASTARLANVSQGQEVGSCTAFSINEDRRYWMTAFHCLGEEMFIDGQIAWSIYKNETHDLVVLQSPGIARPALPLATENPRVGDAIASLGYGYGFAIPQFRRGVVSLLELPGENIHILTEKTTVNVYDIQWMGGMSGGAVVNAAGEVISVVQVEEGGRSGLGRPLETIRKHTAQFFVD
jgi:S1-C subfamily serine protease